MAELALKQDLDLKKYKNAILYLCQSQGGSRYGKMKLAKLLYYIDFDRYEFKESGVTVTGDKYKKWPMGPVPNHYLEIVQSLIEDDAIEVRQKENEPPYRPVEVYSCKVAPDMSVFSEDDRKILERVATTYGALSGSQLANLSHDEAPFIGTKPNDEIAFELAYYRETKFDGVL
jgi:uncharacterized phage-associated protein